MCAWSIRRSTRWPSRATRRIARSCSSPSASRPPRRRPRWRWLQAEREGLENFSLLVSHVLVPPAIEAMLSAPDNGAGLPGGRPCLHGHGLLGIRADRAALPRADRGDRLRAARSAAGHLSLHPAARGGPRRGREPVQPIGAARRQPRRPGRACAGCSRSSRSAGAASARSPQAASDWRPPMRASMRCGALPASPLRRNSPSECISGEILRGLRKPGDCPAFGTRCTPEHPLGATMVSSEGACAAYYRYRRPRARPRPARS